jgi:1-acyl-sn-glycerol-3-phosphate acyltransferase
MTPSGRRSDARRLRSAQRLAGLIENALSRLSAPIRRAGFPYVAPTVPHGVEVPDTAPALGADYDTEWARQPVARAARGLIIEGPLRLAVRAITSPEILGHDRLSDLMLLERTPPVIFAPNHHSHLDTGVMIRAVPAPWRHRLVVAAAADYFFDTRWKAVVSALTLNAVPIDRELTGRRSAELVRSLIDEGNSLVIYPEGGRSPDGWGQQFRGGAAYLSTRTGAPVIPVFIDGTGEIFGKGMKRPKPGRTRVIFGTPLRPSDGESTRRFNVRIEESVRALGDESLGDFWSARQRHRQGRSTPLTGPAIDGWRRQWALHEHRRSSVSGQRRRQRRAWPDLGSNNR